MDFCGALHAVAAGLGHKECLISSVPLVTPQAQHQHLPIGLLFLNTTHLPLKRYNQIHNPLRVPVAGLSENKSQTNLTHLMQVLLLPLQVLPLTDLQNRLMLASDDVPCAWGVQAVCLHAPASHYYFWDPAGFTGDGSVENFQRRCQTEFRAPIPDTWRRYSKGGEWLFGLTCFQPLHWYWSTITWNNDPGADQQVSWLELALDFHASTHCALLRPEQDPATQTAFTMALFFEGASKRLGKICQQTVYL